MTRPDAGTILARTIKYVVDHWGELRAAYQPFREKVLLFQVNAAASSARIFNSRALQFHITVSDLSRPDALLGAMTLLAVFPLASIEIGGQHAENIDTGPSALATKLLDDTW